MALVMDPKKGPAKVTTCPTASGLRALLLPANRRPLDTWEDFRHRLPLKEDLQLTAWWPMILPLTHAVPCTLCEECES